MKETIKILEKRKKELIDEIDLLNKKSNLCIEQKNKNYFNEKLKNCQTRIQLVDQAMTILETEFLKIDSNDNYEMMEEMRDQE